MNHKRTLMPPLERSDLQILFQIVALKHVVTETLSDIEPQRPASTCIRVRNQVLSLFLLCEGPWNYLWHVYQSITRGWGPSWTHWNWCLPTQMLLSSIRKSFPMVPKFFGFHLQSRVASGERTESLLTPRIVHRLVIIYNIPCGGSKHYLLHPSQRRKRTIKSVFSSLERRWPV